MVLIFMICVYGDMKIVLVLLLPKVVRLCRVLYAQYISKNCGSNLPCFLQSERHDGQNIEV